MLTFRANPEHLKAGVGGNGSEKKVGEKVGERGVERGVEKGVEKVNSTRARILRLLGASPSMTISEMSERLKIAPRRIQNHLSALKKSGVLVREGPDRGGVWLVKQ